MGIFQHPHLIRGIVKTAKGAFVISRGLVETPDDIGESLGWRRIDDVEPRTPADTPVSASRRDSSAQRDARAPSGRR